MSKHDSYQHIRTIRELSRFWYVCFYCGGPADGRDHYPPKDSRGCAVPHVVVPCCMECNLIAKNFVQATLEDRLEDVHDKLLQKYGRCRRSLHKASLDAYNAFMAGRGTP